MKLKGMHVYNGFSIGTEVELSPGVNVVTGKNGVGKSRLLSALASGQHIVAETDAGVLASSEIKYISAGDFTPRLDSAYREEDFVRRRSAVLRYFQENKEACNAALNVNQMHAAFRVAPLGELVAPDAAHKEIRGIARKLGKLPSELSEQDVIFNYRGVARDFFDGHDLAMVFNSYLKTKSDNRYNKWLATSEGQAGIDYMESDEFDRLYGRQPWDVLNDLMRSAFGGKFQFSEPKSHRSEPDVPVELIDLSDSRAVGVDQLSSGEKTLLWLVLALFNIQYQSNNVWAPPKLLLLDEPDAFLHPSMTLQLFGFLKLFAVEFNSVIVLTSHSPTTIALAPDDSIFVVQAAGLNKVVKDSAIAELLVGVSQISIDPRNRRQVFVESHYDVDIYDSLYNRLRVLGYLDSLVSLHFVSSGAKVAEGVLTDSLRTFFGIESDERVKGFIAAVNGVGSCSHVIAHVNSLRGDGNGKVRGLIDWDARNKAENGVEVLAPDLAYTIENIALDPIAVLSVLHVDFAHLDKSYSMNAICGKDVSISEFLDDAGLMQEALDRFIVKVLEGDLLHDRDLKYCSGIVLKSDSRYLMCGRDLERLVVAAYHPLKGYIKRSGPYKELKRTIVEKGMVTLGRGKLIPAAFRDAFASLQA